ncbi:hypothetical protein M5K25_023588 [Dendrobium thyrsiflorum]|uniref:Uncharacterized protein n=1 Tax=Dendrobium thyrsiflorum TaxID=117978 RepID=A0ABD0U952_DENTH
MCNFRSERKGTSEKEAEKARARKFVICILRTEWVFNFIEQFSGPCKIIAFPLTRTSPSLAAHAPLAFCLHKMKMQCTNSLAYDRYQIGIPLQMAATKNKIESSSHETSLFHPSHWTAEIRCGFQGLCFVKLFIGLNLRCKIIFMLVKLESLSANAIFDLLFPVLLYLILQLNPYLSFFFGDQFF